MCVGGGGGGGDEKHTANVCDFTTCYFLCYDYATVYVAVTLPHSPTPPHTHTHTAETCGYWQDCESGFGLFTASLHMVQFVQLQVLFTLGIASWQSAMLTIAAMKMMATAPIPMIRRAT